MNMREEKIIVEEKEEKKKREKENKTIFPYPSNERKKERKEK